MSLPQDAPKSNQQPPQYGVDYGNSVPEDSKQTFEQTFKVDKPKYNDWWAGLLLILTFCGFVVISGISLQGYAKTKGQQGGGIYNSAASTFAPNTNTIVLFVFVLCVSFVASWLYFLAARAFTKQFIWITGILNIAIAVATAIYYLTARLWYAGIVFAIFAIFAIICFISWIPRIPFSTLMLRTAMDVAKHVGHIFLISAIGGFCSIAFAAWFSVTLVAIYAKYEPTNNGSNSASGSGASSSKVIGLIVVITFAGFWITEWLKNTIHTIVAGIYGSWYFCSGSPDGIPKGITRGASRRALTYSFGSISFGSLIVAIINTLRQAVSIARYQEGQNGNIIAYICFCLLSCLLSLLDWAVQFINRYAFCHIALYGKAYIPAAKDTWKMMRDRGIDALVNDCLIGPVLSMGSIFVAYLSALLSWLYLHYTKPDYNSGNIYTPVIMAFSFLIGLQVCQIFMTPIASGVDTIFVAIAWDPEVLMRDHPDLYARLIAVYPHVQQAIHA
ncbi:MAG: putative choline transporter, neither null mutation nor overexpression affects choline transport [Cirrosporium novae-zelandiae]|nr:MAG: putative choline transporter, neither null mutation nor overexpression affects choline transport [Cirrosporium novae-zelandiae]